MRRIAGPTLIVFSLTLRFHAVSCARASPRRDTAHRAPAEISPTPPAPGAPRPSSTPPPAVVLPPIPRAPLLAAGDPPRPVAGVCTGSRYMGGPGPTGADRTQRRWNAAPLTL